MSYRENDLKYIDDSDNDSDNINSDNDDYLSLRDEDSDVDQGNDIIDNQDWEGAGGDFTKQYNKLKNQVNQIKLQKSTNNQRNRDNNNNNNSYNSNDNSSNVVNESKEKVHADILTSLSSKFSQQINLAPYTKEKSKEKDKSDRATTEQVLDPRTRLILLKMINRGVISEINGCLSTGKEANVYHGSCQSINDNDEIQLAIKIYKTSILVFKDRDRYVSGEFRFRKGYAKSNPRKMVRLWAEKEMRNLKRLWERGLPCPQPIEVRENVLVMEFFGTNDGWPSPRLKDASIPQSKLSKLYKSLLITVRKMFILCKLVHADLSEYNILYHNSQLYIIDVSQSVEHDHPFAFDFLRSDLRNIENYFKKYGIHTLNLRSSFDFIISENIVNDDDDDDELDRYLDNLLEKSFNDESVKNDEHVKMDDNIFYQSYIPRTLDEVFDPERDAERLKKGEGHELIYGNVTGLTKVNDNIPSDEDIEESESDQSDDTDNSGDDDNSDNDDEDDTSSWKEKAPRGKKFEDKDSKKV